MIVKRIETVATGLTLLGIGAAILWPFMYEAAGNRTSMGEAKRMITLTGVASTGTWTDAAVTGLNYWSKHFPRARPVLVVGQPTLLRFKSADVHHTFYCPALGIESVEVYAGHVVDLVVTPTKKGVFQYFCTMVCGGPHFGMRGEIVVVGEGEPMPERQDDPYDPYWLEPEPPKEADLLVRGQWIFRRMGCFKCHGDNGSGGVPNWNYVKDTVPALDVMADTLMLFYPEDIEYVIDALRNGRRLEDLVDDSPVTRFNAVLAKYDLVRKTIRDGNPPGKKDPDGLTPPLEMPSWKHRLTDRDIDAVVAYLLSLHESLKEESAL